MEWHGTPKMGNVVTWYTSHHNRKNHLLMERQLSDREIAHTLLAEHLSSVPGMYIRQLITAYITQALEGSDASGLYGQSVLMQPSSPQTYTHRHMPIFEKRNLEFGVDILLFLFFLSSFVFFETGFRCLAQSKPWAWDLLAGITGMYAPPCLANMVVFFFKSLSDSWSSSMWHFSFYSTDEIEKIRAKTCHYHTIRT